MSTVEELEVSISAKGRVRRAFTLVELLVVIAVIGVLVAILLPAVQAARESARRSSCVNQMKQQATATHLFHTTAKRFPPGGRERPAVLTQGVSWRVGILPFLEENALHDLIGPTADGGVSNWTAHQHLMPAVFRCPSLESAPAAIGVIYTSSYAGVAGSRLADRGKSLENSRCGDLFETGVLYFESDTRLADITDGSSNTLAIGERAYWLAAWMEGGSWQGTTTTKFRICSKATSQSVYPINARHERHGYYRFDNTAPPGSQKSMLLNDLPFGSLHPGGANFVLADGSVRFLSEEIDIRLFQDLSTISGGEVVSQP